MKSLPALLLALGALLVLDLTMAVDETMANHPPCEENQYFSHDSKECLSCNCNVLGSSSEQCDELGNCE